MNFSRSELIALHQMGGRTEKDVFLDEKGQKYVVMFNPHKTDEDRVYIGKPKMDYCYDWDWDYHLGFITKSEMVKKHLKKRYDGL